MLQARFLVPDRGLNLKPQYLDVTIAKTTSVTYFNARLITQAYLVLSDSGGGNLERDFSSARAFEMLSA